MTAVAVFGSSAVRPGDDDYETAMRCGRLLAEAGFEVVTGGYGGVMEAAARGSVEAGGHATGVTAPDLFPDRAGANRFVSDEVRADSLASRLHHLSDGTVGSIILPGSIGTLAELGFVWNLAFISRYSGNRPKPVITVGDTWRELVEHLARALETDRTMVSTVNTVEEAVTAVSERLGLGD